MPPRPAHHYHPLVRSLAKALRQRCAITPTASIVIACSGGADSVALLRALAMLAPRRKWQLRLIVAHIQHHLRDEAEHEAQFVQHLASEFALPFARRDIHPAEIAGNLEANASELRYQALADVAHQHDAPFIATAHHADDQLETLLMRILRGTSVAGLRGIAWQKALPTQDKQHNEASPLTVIRPMLEVEQNDIRSFLDQLNQPWREDATNGDTTRTRAKLRHDIIPELKQLQPDAASKANTLIEHFADLHALVQRTADAVNTNVGEAAASPFTLPREQARTMNRAVLTELLRRALINAGTPADRLSRHALQPAVLAAQDHVGGQRHIAFSNGITLLITRQAVSIAHK